MRKQPAKLFLPTSRAEWRTQAAGDNSAIRDRAMVWDFSDDLGMMTIDVDGQEQTLRSPVDALYTHGVFSKEAIAAACLAVRMDKALLGVRGYLSVDGMFVSGYDMHGLIHDMIALIDVAIALRFNENGADEMELYTARLLLQLLRNAEARRVIKRS